MKILSMSRGATFSRFTTERGNSNEQSQNNKAPPAMRIAERAIGDINPDINTVLETGDIIPHTMLAKSIATCPFHNDAESFMSILF
jgi:hypothetical protein